MMWSLLFCTTYTFLGNEETLLPHFILLAFGKENFICRIRKQSFCKPPTFQSNCPADKIYYVHLLQVYGIQISFAAYKGKCAYFYRNQTMTINETVHGI